METLSSVLMNLSPAQLEELAKVAQARAKSEKAALRDSAVSKIREIASEAGLKVSFHAEGVKRPFRYVSPDGKHGWSGHGVVPKWLRELPGVIEDYKV